MKQLTLSIVIPVFNEEDHIGPCLEAIAAQSVVPLEVIVVDNNCTDKTVAIAKKFPFVKVVRETKQGRAPARNKGFNSAKGDIIGRIDADSILLPNWVERVLRDFSDKNVMGVTGLAKTNLILGMDGLYVIFWSRIYFWASHAIYRIHTMWGANMALRRSAWETIKDRVSSDDSNVHEDVDISFELVGSGGTIVQDNKLLIKTAGRSYLYWPKFWGYFTKSFSTHHFHQNKGTLKNYVAAKHDFWRYIVTDLIGWLCTLLFIVYAFCMWPIFALLLRTSKHPQKSLR